MVEILKFDSEQEWLEARREYVTATDVARLAGSKRGSSIWHTVRKEKQGESTFNGNAFTAWGQLREPVIAGHVAFLYDMRPNQDLWVSGRFAATPDCVSDKQIAEIKTMGKKLASIEEVFAEFPHYFDQVQWQLMVTGRDECVFVWEQRLGEPGGFEPGSMSYEAVSRDDERIMELVQVAEEFLAWKDEDHETSEWDAFMAEYAEADAVLRDAQARVDGLKQRLREQVGSESLAVQTRFGSISYTWPKPRKSFDSAGFKKAHADLYSEFMREGKPASQATLRITVKEENNG